MSTLPNTSQCHHCHIHSPIPIGDLIRSHPLRSSSVQPSTSVNKKTNGISVAEVHQTENYGNRVNKDKSKQNSEKFNLTDSKKKSGHHHHCKHHHNYHHRCKNHINSKHICKKQEVLNITETSKKNTFLHEDVTLKNSDSGLQHNLGKHNNKLVKWKSLFYCRNNKHLVSTGLLIAGYALLLVVAVVVGVALSQGGDRFRRLRTQSSSSLKPQLPQGAVIANNGRSTHGRANIALGEVFINTGRRSRGPTNVKDNFLSSQTTSRGRARSLNPKPTTTTTTTTEQPIFNDYDYVYIDDIDYHDDHFTLPQITPKPLPVADPIPIVTTAFRPSATRNFPRHRIPDKPEAIKINQRVGTTRQTLPTSFNTRFSLADTKDQEIPRGRKIPNVQILKSWSHRNEDGTYSWGYINSDGSFKNETKGTDCIVRGAFGYPDKETGKVLSFPYESGIACDPDSPDYYVDNNGDVMMSGGQKAKISVIELAQRRKFV